MQNIDSVKFFGRFKRVWNTLLDIHKSSRWFIFCQNKQLICLYFHNYSDIISTIRISVLDIGQIRGMLEMSDIGKVLLTNKPVKCECGGKLFHIGSGKYQCETCGSLVMDDFGKVKQFLEENGVMPIVAISQCTGVSVEVIEGLLKEGRVEISENSQYFLDCQKCGCAIRSGRFCVDCAKELAQGVQKIFYNEIGEKPKEPKMQGKMHFLNRK